MDQTGVWSNNLIAVTSDGLADQTSLKGVWRVDSGGNPTLVANLNTLHLEAVITLTNDAARWGPWAGRIITGDEDNHVLWAIDTNGVAVPYALGIDPEDFDIIPPNQDLYCVDFNNGQSSITEIPSRLFANYVGDLLVTQAGETSPSFSSRLFVISWTGQGFTVRAITYQSSGHFEHVTFAPIEIPALP